MPRTTTQPKDNFTPQKGFPPNAREAALEALNRLERTGAYPKIILDSRLEDSGMPERDRRFSREAVRGTLVWRARLDWVISRLLEPPFETLPVAIRNILRLGVYQILFLDHVPAYAAVSEAVRQARRHGHAGTAGLVNAILRRVAGLNPAELEPSCDGNPAEHIACLWSHPLWLVKRWIARYGSDETESLCRANNRVPPVVLRHNRTRGSLQKTLEMLHEAGVRVRSHPLQEGFLVVEEGGFPFGSPLFADGWVTVQDVSAGLAVCLLDPQPGESVIDLCAAPGGKSGFISERMGNKGRLVAMDRSAGRLGRLRENIKRLGLRNVEVGVSDALRSPHSGVFDRVLVDVPCSNIGVLSRKPDVRWRRTESDLSRLGETQFRLLEKGAAHVSPDGVLVYSTCSTEPEENDNVVTRFLETHPEFETESSIAGLDPVGSDGALRTFPHLHDCDGSFAFRARRLRD